MAIGWSETQIGARIRQAARRVVLPHLQGQEDILVGGQAVIEGVMMRSPHSFAVAVRRPNGAQLETAIKALEAAMELEGRGGGELLVV